MKTIKISVHREGEMWHNVEETHKCYARQKERHGIID